MEFNGKTLPVYFGTGIIPYSADIEITAGGVGIIGIAVLGNMILGNGGE
jgi:hypothetical protein